ncbi:hypothetical protein Hdeb2414_s0001g00029841 [Helianthus debilis subsp. tardiflorus]
MDAKDILVLPKTSLPIPQEKKSRPPRENPMAYLAMFAHHTHTSEMIRMVSCLFSMHVCLVAGLCA